jgi:hypothetical protein
MKYYTTEPGEYPDKGPESSKNEFSGNGWSIKSADGKNVLTYISGSLQGELKSIEITNEEAQLAREGKLSLDEMLIRHGAS